jgi:tRNA threonylcarbamoyladenosine biosynthesis protein TsaB
MNLLAFDTSTDALSIAVCKGAQVWQHSGAGGAQASATLIPAIMALMSQAGLRFEDLNAIAFGKGPGSFTGLRTACSVAQGLALGAGVPVLPVDTLLAVAEEARFHIDCDKSLRVMSLLDARMDEVYAACYEFNGDVWTQRGDYGLCKPEDLMQSLALSVDREVGWQIAGNAHAVYGARLPAFGPAPIHALPIATAMLRLAPALLASGHAVPGDQALPTYIRDKVAKTTLERQIEKAANTTATATR